MENLNASNIAAGLLNGQIGNAGDDEKAPSEAAVKEFDLYKVDYDWIDKQNAKKELRLAHAALKADGYFTDLIKHCEKRMKELDPAFHTQEEKDYVDPVEAKAAMSDVTSFL